jgi:hypothetical protein
MIEIPDKQNEWLRDVDTKEVYENQTNRQLTQSECLDADDADE